MKELNFLQLQDLDKLVFPEEFNGLSLDSPALSFVSDFKDHHPSLLSPSGGSRRHTGNARGTDT